MTKPRILFYDIETAGVNALRSDLGFVLMFGYKWSDEKTPKVLTIAQKDLKHFNDGPLLQRLSKKIEEADLVAAHYGSVFDRRFIQGRLLINNLPPIPPTKMRDTCMIARSVANFSSNRLKHLCKILNLRHQKLDNSWPGAWFRVMQGNMKSLRDMAVYCAGDVLALEELYYKLRPFDQPHPRMFLQHGADGRALCGSCGQGTQYRGFAYKGVHRYRRYVCTSCGKWGTESRRAA